MRIASYLKSLRVRIALAFGSLVAVSTLCYSVFSWFVFDISDDRLFNWHALEHNKQIISQKEVPQSTDLVQYHISNDQAFITFLAQYYGITILNKPNSIDDVESIENIAYYSAGHRIIDLDNGDLQLQIIASPWSSQAKNALFVIYDVSGFKKSESANLLNSDGFALYILIPIAVCVCLFAILFSYLLTRSVLKPLTQLSDQIENTHPESLPKGFSNNYHPDEVGLLAKAFGHLVIRIEDFIDNEKRFSREVSHELRTPTTSLAIALDLLENTALHPNQVKIVSRIRRANNEMISLIRTFLLLAKNSPTDYATESFFLNEYIAAISAKIIYLIENKPVTFSIDIAEHQKAHANPAFLEVVILNLLKNAFQYTSSGSVTVSYRDNTLVITDTGYGISNHEIDNINRVFYSLQPDGIGLGLSIVQRIVRQLEWELSIKSELNKGTCIGLYLGGLPS